MTEQELNSMRAFQSFNPMQTGFRLALKQWLKGELTGHLSTYMYTDDSTDTRWKKGHSSEAYYLGRDDAASLKIALQNIAIKADNVIDLGPGGEAAIVSKAIPLRKLITTPYIVNN